MTFWSGDSFQFWLRSVIIIDGSFRFASDENQLLGKSMQMILDPRLMLQFSSQGSSTSFSDTFPLWQTHSQYNSILVRSVHWPLLMILMTLFFSSVLLFRQQTLYYFSSQECVRTHAMMASAPAPLVWVSLPESGGLRAVFIPESSPDSGSGSGITPSNIVPRARPSELELGRGAEKTFKQLLS